MAKGYAPATPLDAERARLREDGYTDEEISKYFVERLHDARQAPAAGGAPVQRAMTGVLGNASVVLSHTEGKGIIPVLKADLANLSNSAAPAKSRGKKRPETGRRGGDYRGAWLCHFHRWGPRIVRSGRRVADNGSEGG
jgi:hypothetical protein